MNGILIMDKPQDFTSFDVVAKLRGICGTRKIGHGGTLDPMATGVLPVFVGPAAKAVDLQLNHDKTYEAEILFGLSTDTGDITGQTLQQANVNITQQQLQEILPKYTGQIQQLPPMYSAVKVNGKALYRYAREGKTIQRTPRTITIYSIDALRQQDKNKFFVRVHCSKGTYIRTLAEQFGQALGVPATLSALRRTGAGIFTIANAHTFQQVQQAKTDGTLSSLLLPVETVFTPLPAIELDKTQTLRLVNGAPVFGLGNTPSGRYRARFSGNFAGLVTIDDKGVLRGEKLFNTAELNL